MSNLSIDAIAAQFAEFLRDYAGRGGKGPYEAIFPITDLLFRLETGETDVRALAGRALFLHDDRRPVRSLAAMEALEQGIADTLAVLGDCRPVLRKRMLMDLRDATFYGVRSQQRVAAR